jgi:tol-pal system protein YbgF
MLTGIASLEMKLVMPVSPSSILMELLAIRLGCQKTAAKSLVIPRKREREQTNRCASFRPMQRALLLLALCVAAPVQAGLFSDDDARKQIQQLEVRVVKLEEALLKQAAIAEQQVRSLLDLSGQIDALNGEIRKLHGQNEELVRGLQDAEKREKDFYVDLDTRLRRFEPAENSAPTDGGPSAAAVPLDPDDTAAENRAFEAAYGLFKGGSHASAAKAFLDFIGKHPESAHTPNAHYWLGNAQFALKEYQGALDTYQGLIKAFPNTPRAADTLFNIAGCQQELKQDAAAKKTLKQLIAKYPSSEAAAKAKELLATLK